MTTEQFKQAQEIQTDIREVEKEIATWEGMGCKFNLGMRFENTRDHFTELPCRHISDESFQAFRQSCINALKVKRIQLLEKFKSI